MSERMGWLRGSNGVWLEGDEAMVDGLVRDGFSLPSADPAPWVGMGLEEEFPYSWQEVSGWVLHALGCTKNGSAPGPDGIGYQLIKAVRDTRLGRELVDKMVNNLVCGVILPA